MIYMYMYRHDGEVNMQSGKTISQLKGALWTNVLQVTGANKGIGFAIVRILCKEFSGTVILTGNISFYICYGS